MLELIGSLVLALTMSTIGVPPGPAEGAVDNNTDTVCSAPLNYDEFTGELVSEPCPSEVKTATPVRQPRR
jgi:hypothetical protein